MRAGRDQSTKGAFDMNEYILFMHGDVLDSTIADDGQRWETYIAGLRASGQFDGGSSIGPGTRFKKDVAHQPSTAHVTGYIRVRAENIGAAQGFLVGNPTYDAGGTVEVRELLRT
jgi:hypothetical protein